MSPWLCRLQTLWGRLQPGEGRNGPPKVEPPAPCQVPRAVLGFQHWGFIGGVRSVQLVESWLKYHSVKQWLWTFPAGVSLACEQRTAVSIFRICAVILVRDRGKIRQGRVRRCVSQKAPCRSCEAIPGCHPTPGREVLSAFTHIHRNAGEITCVLASL